MSGRRTALAAYADRRVVAVVFLGFSSGLPLALTGSTLAIWLTESGVSLASIGLFALVGLPYSLKFLWSPAMDGLQVPLLGRWLGRRRGWAVATQLALMGALLALGATDPVAAPATVAALALVVAFCSASQDIVVDAFRIEILAERQQATGAAVLVLGYRLGMLASGAGALVLAGALGWAGVYAVMAALVTVGIVTVLLTPEPTPPAAPAAARGAPAAIRLTGWLRAHVLAPFAEFASRPEWLAVLGFIVLYKFGDALAGVMANPFYIQIGFTKVEIAEVGKVFGLAATIGGGLIGGLVVYRHGIMRGLLLCGILQMASNLMFALQAWVGADLGLLMLTVGIENLSGGMGTAAFVAYLSMLCHRAHTATQYALLSSVAALGRTLLSAGGGWLAERLDWVGFFLLSTGAAVPGLALLLWLMLRESGRRKAAAGATEDG